MELTPLKTFVAVAETGQMTLAAARVHLSQPAVSVQLKKLEEELGERLFDRTARGLILTAAGALFLDQVRIALRAIESGVEAVAELTGLERGTLHVGGGATATTYLLPPLLRRFHDLFPRVTISVREQGSRHVVEAIARGELDLGIVTFTPELSERPVRLIPWLRDELVLIVPPGHRLEGRGVFEDTDLEGEQLVLFEAGSAVRRLIDERLNASGIERSIVMELRSIAAIKQMVAAGIGCGFVSRFALTDTETGLAASDGGLSRQLALVQHRDRQRSPSARRFVELLEGHSPTT